MKRATRSGEEETRKMRRVTLAIFAIGASTALAADAPSPVPVQSGPTAAQLTEQVNREKYKEAVIEAQRNDALDKVSDLTTENAGLTMMLQRSNAQVGSLQKKVEELEKRLASAPKETMREKPTSKDVSPVKDQGEK